MRKLILATSLALSFAGVATAISQPTKVHAITAGKTIQLNKQVNGEVSISNKVRTYNVKVDKPGRLILYNAFYADNLTMQVKSSAGTILMSSASGNEYGASLTEPVKDPRAVYVDAGTYTIQVKSNNYTNIPQKFAIKMKLDNQNMTEVENNNSMLKANMIEWSQPEVRGILSKTNTLDYYKIIVPETKKVKIRLSTAMNGMYVYLLNENGKSLVKGHTVNKTKDSTHERLYTLKNGTLNAGTYYVKLVGKKTISGTYTINISQP